MKALLLATVSAGLLWAVTATDADAARCRPGKLFRPSMGVCVSKTSRAGKPYAHHAARIIHHHTHRVRHARAYIGHPERYTRPIPPPPAPPTAIANLRYQPIEPTPYGALLKLPELQQ